MVDIQTFDEIDSTQTEAKRQIDAFGVIDEKIILAKTQTDGITSKPEHKWVSVDGNLMMSYVRFIGNEETEKNHIYFCLGLAVYDSLKAFDKNNGLSIKHPNDIIINKKKICGTLCDVYKKHLIVGVGLNLVNSNFQTARFPATDVETEFGCKVPVEDMVKTIYENMCRYFEMLNNFGFSVIKEQWKKHAYMLGEVVEIRDGVFVKFNDIDDNGEII
jgi:BirA family biotin operon repressor/biotin-[acetyl-CoA-carboxylase] ligase